MKRKILYTILILFLINNIAALASNNSPVNMIEAAQNQQKEREAASLNNLVMLGMGGDAGLKVVKGVSNGARKFSKYVTQKIDDSAAQSEALDYRSSVNNFKKENADNFNTDQVGTEMQEMPKVPESSEPFAETEAAVPEMGPSAQAASPEMIPPAKPISMQPNSFEEKPSLFPEEESESWATHDLGQARTPKPEYNENFGEGEGIKGGEGNSALFAEEGASAEGAAATAGSEAGMEELAAACML